MLKKLFLATGLSLLSMLAAAGPITYSVSRSVGAGTVVGTVTTNGAIGVLTAADITAYELTLSDPGLSGGTASLVGSAVLMAGSGLSATASALSFDFSGGVAALAFATPDGAWCMATAGVRCLGEATPAESLFAGGSAYRLIETAARSGVVELATVPETVPEPGTVALAGLALLAVGMSRRSRRA